MKMPGFTAEASLRAANGHYFGLSTISVNRQAVLPQGETCDVGYIEGESGLWVVCCDPDRDPPCVATGMV